jgi:hypothetical protein
MNHDHKGAEHEQKVKEAVIGLIAQPIDKLGVVRVS